MKTLSHSPFVPVLSKVNFRPSLSVHDHLKPLARTSTSARTQKKKKTLDHHHQAQPPSHPASPTTKDTRHLETSKRFSHPQGSLRNISPHSSSSVDTPHNIPATLHKQTLTLSSKKKPPTSSIKYIYISSAKSPTYSFLITAKIK